MVCSLSCWSTYHTTKFAGYIGVKQSVDVDSSDEKAMAVMKVSAPASRVILTVLPCILQPCQQGRLYSSVASVEVALEACSVLPHGSHSLSILTTPDWSHSLKTAVMSRARTQITVSWALASADDGTARHSSMCNHGGVGASMSLSRTWHAHVLVSIPDMYMTHSWALSTKASCTQSFLEFLTTLDLTTPDLGTCLEIEPDQD